MSVLLITYDLNKPGQDYTDFRKVVNDYGGKKLSESSYAIKTDETPKAVYDKLRKYMDDGDQLYVVTLTKPYMGWGPEETNGWISHNLPN